MRALLQGAAREPAVGSAAAERFPDWFIRMTRPGIDVDEATLRRLVVEFADRLLDFNVEAAWAYGRILASARGAGRPMAVPDAAIDAIAQANRGALACARQP